MMGERYFIRIRREDSIDLWQWCGVVRFYVMWFWPVATYRCRRFTKEGCIEETFNILNRLLKE